jgi:hypothetical protein
MRAPFVRLVMPLAVLLPILACTQKGGAAGSTANSNMGTTAVSKQFSAALQLGKPNEPLVMTAYLNGQREGRLVTCLAYFLSGPNYAMTDAYTARVNDPASKITFKPQGETPFSIPSAGTPVYWVPPPPDKPNGQLKPDDVFGSGRTSRCYDTGHSWTTAVGKAVPFTELVPATP